VVITNDGVTVLEAMEIEHPTGKMIVEIAKTQEEETGDGTTTAVVLAGELLKRAEGLLEDDVHPTTVATGYRIAADRAEEMLTELAVTVNPGDADRLAAIAGTVMTGKGAGRVRELLSGLIVEAVTAVADPEAGTVDLDDISVVSVVGGSIADTELVEGVVLEKKRAHEAMPIEVTDARVALVETPIEVRTTETDAEIRVTTPEQLQTFLKREEVELRDVVTTLVNVGANVVVCRGVSTTSRSITWRARASSPSNGWDAPTSVGWLGRPADGVSRTSTRSTLQSLASPVGSQNGRSRGRRWSSSRNVILPAVIVIIVSHYRWVADPFWRPTGKQLQETLSDGQPFRC
jgi:chaperonin GroEL (HSP60 family)